MALTTDWRLVAERLEQYSRRPGLGATAQAIGRIVQVLREDDGLAGVQRGLSHVALRLGYSGVLSFVLVSWTARDGYTLSIWGPRGEIQAERSIDAADASLWVHRYLERLRREGVEASPNP